MFTWWKQYNLHRDWYGVSIAIGGMSNSEADLVSVYWVYDKVNLTVHLQMFYKCDLQINKLMNLLHTDFTFKNKRW